MPDRTKQDTETYQATEQDGKWVSFALMNTRRAAAAINATERLVYSALLDLGELNGPVADREVTESLKRAKGLIESAKTLVSEARKSIGFAEYVITDTLGLNGKEAQAGSMPYAERPRFLD